MNQNQTESKPTTPEQPTYEGLDETPCSSSWMPIETSPIADHGYFFARIAWGPDEDKHTGDGVRHKGEWHAAALFYQLGQDRKYGFREHRVVPTHWKPHDLFQTNETSAGTDASAPRS